MSPNWASWERCERCETCESDSDVDINTVAVDPFNSDVILAGSCAGGLFKTDDGGENWWPVTDDFAWMAMGSIAFDQSQEGLVYLGSSYLNECVFLSKMRV